MNTKEQLLRRMAQLESMNDQLMTELVYLDQLMRSIGFTHGLETVKATAKELVEKDNSEEQKEVI